MYAEDSTEFAGMAISVISKKIDAKRLTVLGQSKVIATKAIDDRYLMLTVRMNKRHNVIQ